MSEIEGASTRSPSIRSTMRRSGASAAGRARVGPNGKSNRLVREYASGRHKGSAFRVTVDQGKRVVGVAAFLATDPSQPMLGRFGGSPYISVIGLSACYRGRSSLGLRLGDLLLRDVLRSINEKWGGTPHVFALVDPDNRASRDLFERNGFRMIIPANGNGHEADSLFRRIGGQIPT